MYIGCENRSWARQILDKYDNDNVYLQVLELHIAIEKQEIYSLTIENRYESIYTILRNVSDGSCGEKYVLFWQIFLRNMRYFQLFRNTEKEWFW